MPLKLHITGATFNPHVPIVWCHPPCLAPAGRTPLHNLLMTLTPPYRHNLNLSLSLVLTVDQTAAWSHLCHQAWTFPSLSPCVYNFLKLKKTTIFCVRIFSSHILLFCCPRASELYFSLCFWRLPFRWICRHLKSHSSRGGRFSLSLLIVNSFPVHAWMQWWLITN